jgi:membrane associated rhomboid family serine protease
MVTYIIIGITSLISFLAFSNRDLFNKLLFNAAAVHNDKQWYRLFTHGLVHADFGHLMLNMFVLYSFGTAIEDYYFKALFSGNSSVMFAILYTLIMQLELRELYRRWYLQAF